MNIYGNYGVDQYYNDVKTFNDIIGNLTDVNKEKLVSQVKVLTEECKELTDAIDLDDLDGIIDGAVDVTYVVFGVLQMLHNLGYKVERAMHKTAENNLTKFPSDVNTILDSVEDYKENGTYVQWGYNKYYSMYYIKDESGKIRKPLGYVKNDLKDCLPKMKG